MTHRDFVNWQALPNAPRSWRFDDMYFRTPLEGWAINPNYNYLTPNQFGRVAHTTDGGQTWEVLLDSSVTFIRSVGFADSLHGWFGNLGLYTPDTIPFYATQDGGHTWTPVPLPTTNYPKGICGISIATDSAIYGYGRYFGPSIMLSSKDQGQTWGSASLDSLASGLVDGWFFGADTGFVIGSAGSPPQAMVMSTFDGGASWQVRHTSPRLDEIGWKIYFPSRQVGYVAVESWLNLISPQPPDTTWLLKTTDGGLTWVDRPIATQYYYRLQGIGFINEQVGWAGGDCCRGYNFMTTNGGDTWTTVTPGLGILTPPYAQFGGYALNRFRSFGDTLMYASGNTIYKMDTSTAVGLVPEVASARGVLLYPNPVLADEGVLRYELAEDVGAGPVCWRFYDLLGRSGVVEVVTSGRAGELRVRGLAAGGYGYVAMRDGVRLGVGVLVVE